MSSRAKVVLTAIVSTLVSAVPHAHAQAIVAVQENGKRVYVNDVAITPEGAWQRPSVYRLVYWSQTERRWKPVPGAHTMRAARSAASEVRQYLGMSGVAVPKLAEAQSAEAMPAAPADKPESAGKSELAAKPQRSPEQVDTAIEQAAARHHVDPNLVRAIVKVESNFNPRAISRKGAMGLMQLMPGTARELAVSNPFDPQQNVDAGVRHLKGLLDSYGGDLSKSLAAYNAGQKAVARNNGVPPYAETRDYVKRITQLYGAGRATTPAWLPPQIKVVRGRDGVLTISNTD